MAFCSKCGNQLDGDTRFCEKCGQAVELQLPAAAVSYNTPPTAYTPPMRVVPKPKPKGMMSKVFGILLMIAATIGLNFIGVPGYVAALVIGFLSSVSLLGKNQNGRLREKLALIAAFAMGAIAYYIASAQAYGMYVGAVVFHAVGFGLTRLYKENKPDYRLWLAETLPTVLRFVLLERVGGAVSGLGFAFNVGDLAIPVRYIEAFVFLIAYIILQARIEKHKITPKEGYGQRDCVLPKRQGLKNFCKIAAVAIIAIMWLNPAHIIVFDNIKNSVMDSLMVFSVADKTTIENISDFNGTNLFFFDSPTTITNEAEAKALLSESDKQLTGEFMYTGSEKLTNGNTVYSFAQTSKGIPIYGASKKLVVDKNNKPLYALGQTRLGVGNLTVGDDMGDKQATQTAQVFFDGEDAKIGQLTKAWKLSADGYNDAYQLVYAAPVTFSGDDYTLEKANLFFSATSGSIVDIDVGDADGQLADIYEQAKGKGKFNDADFDAIVQSANTIISGVDVNAWIYRDVLMQECQRYYMNQGNEKLGKNNANAFMNAFKAAGVSKNNNDEGVVKVTMGANKATVKGSLNYPYAIKQMIITHTDDTTQQYAFKSDVPVVLTVSKMSGETVLTLPVYDEATFDIYPAGHDEEYVVTIQAGSEYQSSEKAMSAPIIPGTLAIQALAAAPASQWLYGRAQTSYELTLKQLDADLRIEDGDRITKMLRSIEAAYNADNGARFVSLYRLDELGAMLRDQDYIRMMESMSPFYAKLFDAALSGNTLGLLAQTYLSAYRVANDIWVRMAGGSKEFGDFGEFQDAIAESAARLISTSPDKTAIAFLLVGTQGDFLDWIENFDKRMLRLDDTTLKLRYVGSTQKGDKTFVKVTATISRKGAKVLEDTTTIVIQHFGDISSRFSQEESGDWWDLVSRMKQFWTAGDYLGLDLSKLKIDIPKWTPDSSWGVSDNTSGNNSNWGTPDNKSGNNESKPETEYTAQPTDYRFTYASGMDEGNFQNTIWYTDSYFEQRSDKYNPQLATASLCMAMAAFGQAGGIDSLKDTNIQNLLKTLKFENIESDSYKKRPTENSIAYAIAHKESSVGDYNIVALAVRGGGYEREWGGNFEIGESGEHANFERAKDEVIRALKKYLSDHRRKLKGKPVQLWITGYSRGSAVANLVAAEINRNILSYPLIKGRQNVFAYCFATPAGTTDKNYNNSRYNNIFCMVNPNDFVPRFAPQEWGFHRYGITRIDGATNHDAIKKRLATIEPYKSAIAKLSEGPSPDVLAKGYLIGDFNQCDAVSYKILGVETNIRNYLGAHTDAHKKGIFTYYYTGNRDQGAFLGQFIKHLSTDNNFSFDIGFGIQLPTVKLGTGEAFESRSHYYKKFQNQMVIAVSNTLGNNISEGWWKIFDLLIGLAVDDWSLLNEFGSLPNALGNLKDLAQWGLVWKRDDLCTLYVNGDSIMQGHRPEVYLAWMQSMDSNYR